jgi:hypothetical protein
MAPNDLTLRASSGGSVAGLELGKAKPGSSIATPHSLDTFSDDPASHDLSKLISVGVSLEQFMSSILIVQA